MSDIEIPENEWLEFCAAFTRQHHGWLVNMRQFDTVELKRVATSPEALDGLAESESM
jgi:hypothetical protein